MPSPNTCLSDEALKSFVEGFADEQQSAAVAHHLEHCPRCLEKTRAVKSGDTLVAALRAADVASTESPAPSLMPLIERLLARQPEDTLSTRLDNTSLGTPAPPLEVSELLQAVAPPQSVEELGRIGTFRLLGLLGAGGMGAVLLAEDVQLKRRVAVKLLKPELTSRPDASARFLREAQAAAAVKHDHVVTIYQVGEAGGVPFIAQELLEGEPLDARLRREPQLPLSEAVRIGKEIAAGLAAAHAKGLLHRDIKPANVFLEGPGARVKILDFGLARLQSDDGSMTKTGTILGTPAFMSPEQASAGNVDPRSDLFSLGGVLYRLTTGRMPFQGSDTLSLLRSLAVDTPSPPRSINPAVPVELSQLIVQLLEKDADKRPSSAQEVAQRLAVIAIPQTMPAGESPPARRRTALVWGAAAAGLALLGVIVILIKRPDGSKVELRVPDDSVVEIKNEPGEAKPAVPATENDDGDLPRHRRAVRDLVGSGANVSIAMPDGSWQTLKADGPLPTESWTVEAIAFTNEKPFRNEFLRPLADLPMCKTLTLDRVQLSDAGATWIAKCPSLDYIVITGGDLSNDGIKELSTLPSLRHLILRDVRNLSGVGMLHLASHKDMRYLTWERNATDEGLAALEGWDSLESLALSGSIRGKGLRHLAGSRRLAKLDLAGNPLDDEGLRQLPEFPLLEQLLLHYTRVGDAGVRHLVEHYPRLKSISLEGTAVTDDGLRELVRLRQLEHANLAATPLTDETLLALAELPNWKDIWVRATKVTPAGVEAFRKKHPKCEVKVD